MWRKGKGSADILKDLGVPQFSEVEAMNRVLAQSLSDMIMLTFNPLKNLALKLYETASGNQVNQHFCEVGRSKSGQEYVCIRHDKVVGREQLYALDLMMSIFREEEIEEASVFTPVSIFYYLKPNECWPAERIQYCFDKTMTAAAFGRDPGVAWTEAVREHKAKSSSCQSVVIEEIEGEGVGYDKRWVNALHDDDKAKRDRSGGGSIAA